MASASKFRADVAERPGHLVWTRMQAEAGQGLSMILKRKEREREAGGGKFFWGVGNAPSKMISSLARTASPVAVVFSRMKSKPKTIDQNPKTTVLWRQYIDSEGRVRPLPPQALITSRGESIHRNKRTHYALECYSAAPLLISEDAEVFDPSAYRNAGGTGAPVGASQVTSLLVPSEFSSPRKASAYLVNMRASLAGSYWVKLVDPLRLSGSDLELIERSDVDQQDWPEFVARLRHVPNTQVADDASPLLL